MYGIQIPARNATDEQVKANWIEYKTSSSYQCVAMRSLSDKFYHPSGAVVACSFILITEIQEFGPTEAYNRLISDTKRFEILESALTFRQYLDWKNAQSDDFKKSNNN